MTLVAGPTAVTGQSYDYNGTSYLVVDDATIAANKTANIVTTRVTDMAGMFYSASAFNGDISSWDTAAVTDMMVYVLFCLSIQWRYKLLGYCSGY